MQTCPTCGAEVPSTAKFCTKCGTPLSQSTVSDDPSKKATTTQEPPAQSQLNESDAAELERLRQLQSLQRAEQMKKFKKSSSNYWVYLRDSWAAPSIVVGKKYNKWFGLLSMAIWSLMGCISVSSAIQAGVSGVQSATSSLASLFDASDTANSVNSNIQSNAILIYIKIFILLFVGMLVFGAVGFAFRRWAQHDQISYLDYLTDLMHRGNLNLILVLCSMVLALIGGLVQILNMLFVSLGGSLFVVGFMQSIIVPKNRTGFDSVYLTVLAMIALEVALTIITLIFGHSLIGQFSSFF